MSRRSLRRAAFTATHAVRPVCVPGRDTLHRRVHLAQLPAAQAILLLDVLKGYIQPELLATRSSARRVHPVGAARHKVFGTQSTSSRSYSPQGHRHAEYIQSELLATGSSARRVHPVGAGARHRVIGTQSTSRSCSPQGHRHAEYIQSEWSCVPAAHRHAAEAHICEKLVESHHTAKKASSASSAPCY